MEAPSRWSRLRELFLAHRRRLATGALILFLAAVALEIGGAYPRSVEVSVPLGRAHANVAEAQIEYLQDGERVRAVTRRFREQAPREVRDRVELSPGDYDVSVLLIDHDGRAQALSGRLRAPADGVVRIALSEGT